MQTFSQQVKPSAGKNSSKIKKIGVKVDSRIIWPVEDQDHRLLIKIVMTIMTMMMMMVMMMMMITITIQRGPSVFTMLGIFLAMQSLVKKTKAKKMTGTK